MSQCCLCPTVLMADPGLPLALVGLTFAVLWLQVIIMNPGNGGSSLANKDKLVQLYTSSYSKSMPVSGSARRLASTGTYLTAAQLQQLFSRIAEVR